MIENTNNVSPSTDFIYWYRAKCLRIVDGDTIQAAVDLGMSIGIVKETFRLYGINTPEIRGSAKEAGLKSKAYVESKIADKEIMIKTHKDKKGSFSRYLAVVWYWENEESDKDAT